MNKEIRPSSKYLSAGSINNFIMSWFMATIPLLVVVFIRAFLEKFGTVLATNDLDLIKNTYFISVVLIFIFRTISLIAYVKKTYILVDKNSVEIYRAFLTTTKNQVMYASIESVEINQSVVEKIFGLSTVFINTKSIDEQYELAGFEYGVSSLWAEKLEQEYKIKVA
jgi:uncharacterized membrane protein YdbT with pleckstrin-like domain